MIQQLDPSTTLKAALSGQHPSTWQLYYDQEDVLQTQTNGFIAIMVASVIVVIAGGTCYLNGFLFPNLTFLAGSIALLIFILLMRPWRHKTKSLLVLQPKGVIEFPDISLPNATFLLDFATVDHLDISTKQESSTTVSSIHSTTHTKTHFYLDIYYKNRTVGRWPVKEEYAEPAHLVRSIIWMFESGRRP